MINQIDQRISQVGIGDAEITLQLIDGRRISAPRSWFSRLAKASEQALGNYEISDDGQSVRWRELEEIIEVETLLRFDNHCVRRLRSAAFDEDFLIDLDATTQGLAITAGGFRFCGQAYGKGLSPDQIRRAEEAVGATFPEDFRFFLANLHDPKGVFFPWGKVTKQLYRAKIDKVISGFLFDAESNAFWLDGWGERPKRESERAEIIRYEILKWPKLAPIRGHRYMAIEPNTVGNPVLSIHQSDVIYYGPDIGRYLCNEFLHVGQGAWIDSWRWADAPPRAEFDPWNALTQR